MRPSVCEHGIVNGLRDAWKRTCALQLIHNGPTFKPPRRSGRSRAPTCTVNPLAPRGRMKDSMSTPSASQIREPCTGRWHPDFPNAKHGFSHACCRSRGHSFHRSWLHSCRSQNADNSSDSSLEFREPTKPHRGTSISRRTTSPGRFPGPNRHRVGNSAVPVGVPARSVRERR